MLKPRLEHRIASDSHDQEWWEGFCEITDGTVGNKPIEYLAAWEETERSILNDDPVDIGGSD